METSIKMDSSSSAQAFNPLEPFSFTVTIDEWLKIKPKDDMCFNSDGRRGLQPGWTDIFESKLRHVNPSCVRWYTGSVKKPSSRKVAAPFFTGRASCRHPDCTLTYRLVIEEEPTVSSTSVEVIVTPQGNFVASDPYEVQNRADTRIERREYLRMLEDDAEESCAIAEESGRSNPEYPNFVAKRFPPFIRYGKRPIGGSSNILVGCGSGRTLEDLLYCSTLEADRDKLLAEKEKLNAETIMLRAKTEALIAKKAKLETETNNLIIQRVKLKHELNAMGLDVEIVSVDDGQIRPGTEIEDRS